ncbi:energy transducer TonB [Salinisphaera sp. T31B1]|uniref:energy transducer TonB n=1 Tax=Salinisphaera sp. T31B1 TaxID=727963 RepID=UPI003341F305
MNITRGQWLLAFGVAAVVHLALLALFLVGDRPPESSADAPSGVMVSLDTLEPGLPADSAIDSAPVEAATPAEIVPSAPTPTPSESPMSAAELPTQVPEAATDIGPEPSAQPPTDVADRSATEAEPRDSPPATGATATPRVAAAVTIRPQEISETIRPAEQVTARTADPNEFGAPETASQAQNGAYGDSEQSTDDYIVQLRAWLSRHKQYPMAARNQQIEGTVRVYLVIDANGNILNQRIVESSGSQMLDNAARQMLERSEPLPRMPATMRRNRLELVVPVVFSLR